ncbi:MAG: hypothetical protein ACRDRR_00305 [Pseudonocardiaceae bacterium]
MTDEDLRFRSSDYVLPAGEIFAYGIETIQIKKHVWPDHNAVLHGALLHDAESGEKYFVTQADLARYEGTADSQEYLGP